MRGIGGTLRLIYWEAPSILNPHLSTALKDWEASRITYEPLASYSNEGELVPFLAAEIPSIENGDLADDYTSVTWRLKEGVKWSDGEDFTAEDVLFTYEFAMNPDIGSYSANIYSSIETIEALDDYTVQITYKEPEPAWMLPFTGTLGLIIPRHKFEDYNGKNAREAPANWGDEDGATVGTGPYRVVSFKPQEVLFLGDSIVETNKIEYRPNEHFRDPDQPYFSKVELRGGGTAREAGRLVLEEGTADYAYNLQMSDEELIPMEEAGKGEVRRTFGSRVHLIQLNHSNPISNSQRDAPHPMFQDLRVREAFAYAIDREHIAETVYGKSGRATTNFLVVPEEFRSPHSYHEFDLEKAADLLDEAGWVDTNDNGIRDKDGVEMQVVYRSFVNPFVQPIQQIVQEDLGEVGIDMEIDITDISKFFGAPSNQESYYRFLSDMQSFDIVMDNRAPVLHLGTWTCDQVPTEENGWSFFNATRWCNPEYDDLIAEAQSELDEEKRKELIIELDDMLIQDVGIIPVVHVAQVSGVSNSLEGVDITPWDSDTWNIKDWKRSAAP